MCDRSPAYAPILLVLTLVATAACGGGSVNPSSPAPSAPAKSSITAEPLVARPEFLQNSSCSTRPPFGVRITVILGGVDDLIVRGVGFAFTDRFGDRALPDVFPVPSGSTSMPSSSPIPFPGPTPIPGSSPIPIPGSSPINGVFVSAGASHSQTFFLRFGCGLIPEGMLVVSGDVADRTGRPSTVERRIPVR